MQASYSICQCVGCCWSQASGCGHFGVRLEEATILGQFSGCIDYKRLVSGCGPIASGQCVWSALGQVNLRVHIGSSQWFLKYQVSVWSYRVSSQGVVILWSCWVKLHSLSRSPSGLWARGVPAGSWPPSTWRGWWGVGRRAGPPWRSWQRGQSAGSESVAMTNWPCLHMKNREFSMSLL